MFSSGRAKRTARNRKETCVETGLLLAVAGEKQHFLRGNRYIRNHAGGVLRTRRNSERSRPSPARHKIVGWSVYRTIVEVVGAIATPPSNLLTTRCTWRRNMNARNTHTAYTYRSRRYRSMVAFPKRVRGCASPLIEFAADHSLASGRRHAAG